MKQIHPMKTKTLRTLNTIWNKRRKLEGAVCQLKATGETDSMLLQWLQIFSEASQGLKQKCHKSICTLYITWKGKKSEIRQSYIWCGNICEKINIPVPLAKIAPSSWQCWIFRTVFVAVLMSKNISSCMFRLRENYTSSKCEPSELTFVKIKHAGELVRYTSVKPAQNLSTEPLRLCGTSGDDLVQQPKSGVSQARLPRTAFWWVLNFKDKNYTTYWDNLFHCLTSLRGKRIFSYVWRVFPVFEDHGIIEYPRLNASYSISDITSQVLLALQETGPEKVLDTPLQFFFVKCGNFHINSSYRWEIQEKSQDSVPLASLPVICPGQQCLIS